MLLWELIARCDLSWLFPGKVNELTLNCQCCLQGHWDRTACHGRTACIEVQVGFAQTTLCTGFSLPLRIVSFPKNTNNKKYKWFTFTTVSLPVQGPEVISSTFTCSRTCGCFRYTYLFKNLWLFQVDLPVQGRVVVSGTLTCSRVCGCFMYTYLFKDLWLFQVHLPVQGCVVVSGTLTSSRAWRIYTWTSELCSSLRSSTTCLPKPTGAFA